VEIKKVRFFNHILLSYSKVCCAAVLVGWIWMGRFGQGKKEKRKG
jgi:hypothetical protein